MRTFLADSRDCFVEGSQGCPILHSNAPWPFVGGSVFSGRVCTFFYSGKLEEGYGQGKVLVGARVTITQIEGNLNRISLLWRWIKEKLHEAVALAW